MTTTSIHYRDVEGHLAAAVVECVSAEREKAIRECAERAWLSIPDPLRADIVRDAILELLIPARHKP